MLLQPSESSTTDTPHVVTLRLLCTPAGVVVNCSDPNVDITTEYITYYLSRKDREHEVRFVFLDPLGGPDVGLQPIEASPPGSVDVDGNAVTMPIYAELQLRLEVAPPATAGKKKLPKIPHDTTIRVRPKGGGI